MNHALGVCFDERIGNFSRNPEYFAEAQRRILLESLLQRLAVQILHDQEGCIGVHADVVNDANVSMLERCDRASLTPKVVTRLR